VTEIAIPAAGAARVHVLHEGCDGVDGDGALLAALAAYGPRPEMALRD
jgi:hypothetical protein